MRMQGRATAGKGMDEAAAKCQAQVCRSIVLDAPGLIVSRKSTAYANAAAGPEVLKGEQIGRAHV